MSPADEPLVLELWQPPLPALTIAEHAEQIGRELARLIRERGAPNDFRFNDMTGIQIMPETAVSVASQSELLCKIRIQTGHHVDPAFDCDRPGVPITNWSIGPSLDVGPLAGLYVVEVPWSRQPGRGKYWAAGGNGYTGAIALAGVFTKEEAPKVQFDKDVLIQPALSAVLDALSSTGRDYATGFCWSEMNNPKPNTIGGRLGFNAGAIVRGLATGNLSAVNILIAKAVASEAG